jgi:hypothetical protein
VIIPSAQRALRRLVALAAAVAGAIVALHYHRLGLTLTHYDARGHLVVARRIADSITPGWQQVGAVWLPLPHLLNALPVQLDILYRTGASAVAISIASFAIATAAIASIVMAITGSAPASIAAAAVFALNPNVLYLQSTPMTEPLLLALTTVSVAVLIDSSRREPALVGWLFALACLTRYEAWPVTAAALAAAVWIEWRRGNPFRAALRSAGAIALYPAVAIVAFIIFSRVVIGQWFVASGFFVPENKALHDPVMAAAEIWWGAHMLSGYAIVLLGAAGVAALAAIGVFDRQRPEALAVVALAATAVIPWAAFLDGHPFRIRYIVPLIAIEAIGAGVVAGLVRRWHVAGAILVAAVAAYELRPVDVRAPMVVEAQWDRPNVPARAQVTACLPQPGSGEKIMASMGSLGHYMQEASGSGFSIRDFLHEGNGDIWLAALDHPQLLVNWILIEEKAEGGDMLARLAREHPMFLSGYSRECEAAGLVLYKRDALRAIRIEN